MLNKLNIEHIPIDELLPHKSPMLLLDHAKYFAEDYIHTVVKITKDSLFFSELCENEGVPAYIALEYMAQSIAVWNGMLARKQNTASNVGLLVGSRDLILKIMSFKAGEVLDIHGKANYNDGCMASFDCWVEQNHKIIVTATLNVFQPSDIKEFMENAKHAN